MNISIPTNDLEANLSYAYLHAVAARLGAVCKIGERDEDNKGIDAVLRVWGPFPDARYIKSVHLDVQLKATVAPDRDNGEHLSFFFRGKERYERLCEPCEAVPPVLMVLFLPQNQSEWMELSSESLLLRRCAYWESLRGAPSYTNKTGETVYLPKSQAVTPESLWNLAARIAVKNYPTYRGVEAA